MIREPADHSHTVTGILRTGASPDLADFKEAARDSSSDHKTLSRPESLVYADPVTGEPPEGFLTSTERILTESELSEAQERARIARRQAKQGMAEQNLERLTHRL